MSQQLSDKIILLNQATLESFKDTTEKEIVSRFTETGIKILGADFGFVWFRERGQRTYKLIYKHAATPYQPNKPRKKGTNYQVRHNEAPLLISDIQKAIFVAADAKVYMKSAAVIPIVYKNNTYGNAVICFAQRKKFTEEDRGLCTFLGNSLAQAITINRLYTRLKDMAYHDSLTLLPNRVSMQERLQEIHESAKHEYKKFAVLFCDIDEFKTINDLLGHAEGDRLLRLASARLKHAVKKSDLVSRMGGDEFMILLPDVKTDEDVLKVARRLQKTFKNSFKLQDQEVYINISTGISIYPEDGETIPDLMKNADYALYQVKEEGGRSFHKHHLTFKRPELSNIILEKELRVALKKNEFQLHYQPIVDPQNGMITSCEALVRWHHPTLGTVSPQAFVSRAENTGIIIPIGE